MKPFAIYTKYGETYKVNEYGQITSKNSTDASDTWMFAGFAKVMPFGRLSFDASIDDVIDNPLFKNRKSRYTVCDIDHGTFRIWGNIKAHGIHRVYYI